MVNFIASEENKRLRLTLLLVSRIEVDLVAEEVEEAEEVKVVEAVCLALELMVAPPEIIIHSTQVAAQTHRHRAVKKDLPHQLSCRVVSILFFFSPAPKPLSSPRAFPSPGHHHKPLL